MSQHNPSKLFLAVGLMFLVGACQKDNKSADQARFYENGLAKPIVALVPMIDSSRSELSWNLSDEMTALVHYRLLQKNKMYLVDEEKIGSILKKVKESNNPFDTDLNWVKRSFLGNEFVVFMELLSHDETSLVKEGMNASDAPSELSMRVRVRVIDLREEQPKIVLQEIIQDVHLLPKQFNQTNASQVEWGKENYSISPIGMAHTQLSKEIASRLEDYILLSTSPRS